MPLEFSERERRALSTRLMVQAPPGLTPRQLKSAAAFMDRAVKGLPGDVFMALDALRLLADQGNETAKHVFDEECAKLGLDTVLAPAGTAKRPGTAVVEAETIGRALAAGVAPAPEPSD